VFWRSGCWSFTGGWCTESPSRARLEQLVRGAFGLQELASGTEGVPRLLCWKPTGVVGVSCTVWDLRGLEHAVAVYFVDHLVDCWLEDVPGLRPWLRKRWRLDVPLSSFLPLAEEFGGSLPGVLCDLVRHLFRVRCYPSEVRWCATVGDLVSLVCSRLEPVPGEPWCSPVEGLEGEEGDLLRQVEAAFSALPVRWGPHGVVRAHEITEALPCWCGSGLPFLRCCGTGWRPRPGWRSHVRRYL